MKPQLSPPTPLHAYVRTLREMEDVLMGYKGEPFSVQYDYDDLRDLIRDSLLLAWLYAEQEWDCSAEAVERAAERRAEEILAFEHECEVDLDIDQGWRARHGGG